MKKTVWMAAAAGALLVFFAGGCGSAAPADKSASAQEAPKAAAEAAAPKQDGPKKMLILYYSLAGGNTKSIADQLQQATGADIERIEPQTPYSGSYDDIVAQGKREVDEGYRPALKALAHQPEDYDIIAVGTPTWWYTMAPPVLTLLSEHDWSGKTIIPFQTHAGWPGHTLEDMQAAAPGAEFRYPLQVKFDHQTLASPQADIDGWLADVKTIL